MRSRVRGVYLSARRVRALLPTACLPSDLLQRLPRSSVRYTPGPRQLWGGSGRSGSSHTGHSGRNGSTHSVRSVLTPGSQERQDAGPTLPELNEQARDRPPTGGVGGGRWALDRDRDDEGGRGPRGASFSSPCSLAAPIRSGWLFGVDVLLVSNP